MSNDLPPKGRVTSEFDATFVTLSCDDEAFALLVVGVAYVKGFVLIYYSVPMQPETHSQTNNLL